MEPCLPVASKTAIGREKDRLVLPTLEEALRVREHRKKR